MILFKQLPEFILRVYSRNPQVTVPWLRAVGGCIKPRPGPGELKQHSAARTHNPRHFPEKAATILTVHMLQYRNRINQIY